MHFDTLVAGEVADPRTTRPHNLPIYATSSFAFDNIEQGIDIFQNIQKGHVYSRYANPTVDAVAEKIAQLETYGTALSASAVMTSSGMSAITTLVFGILKKGDKLLTQGNLYGGTTELFNSIVAPLGIDIVWAQLQRLDIVEEMLQADPRIRMIYAETPANPALSCVDLSALAKLARQYGIYSVVDNTFATPVLQRPLTLGIDFVVHSTTKYLNGHGNSTAGVVVGRDREIMQQKVWNAMKLLGTNCSPFEAWLTHNGMKTLCLRMQRQCENAFHLARLLAQSEQVMHVNYPGLAEHPDHPIARRQMHGGYGAMLSFELKGGWKAGTRMMNHLKRCTLAPTLGDVDTLVLHPASMSHLRVPRDVRLANGITDGLIRVSVGIEHPDDIAHDIMQAIRQSATAAR